MEQVEQSYRRGVRHSFFGLLGVSVLQFLQLLVFARWAGPAAAGDYALAAAFMGFLAPLAEAGISQAVVQAKSWRAEQLAALAWLSLAFGVFILLVLWGVAPAIARWYGRPELQGLLPLMAVSLLVTPFAAAQGGLLVRDFRFDLSAKIETAAHLVGFVLLISFLALGWGVWAMALSFVGRNVFAALACWWLARNLYPIDWWQPARLRSVWPMLRFGSLDLSARWADYLANYLDKLIVGKWLGVEALGFYQIAFSLCVLPTARLGYVVTRVTYPVFARLRSDAVQLQVFFQRSAEDVVLLVFPVYLSMALFAEEIMGVLYGPKWLAAAPILVVFSIGGLVRSLNAVFPQLTKGIGKPQLTTAWMGLWTLFSTLFLFVFLALAPTALAASWSRVTAKFLIELPLLFLLAHWCGVRFQPVLAYAARFLGACLPLVFVATLFDWLTIDKIAREIVKMVFWGGGLCWLAVYSPWKKDLQRVLALFASNKPEEG